MKFTGKQSVQIRIIRIIRVLSEGVPKAQLFFESASLSLFFLDALVKSHNSVTIQHNSIKSANEWNHG